MINIHLSFPNPLTHLIHVQMQLDTANLKSLDMILPAWRPGRYELAPFSENIQQYSAKDQNENSLHWQKNAPNVWAIDTPKANQVTICYQYYAHKMDAGNSVINDEMIYINFINCIMYEASLNDEVINLNIDIPDSYQHTCSLESTDQHHFIAPSYHHLVDAPLLASANLKKISYQLNQTQFEIVISGNCPLSEQTLISDFRKFTEVQIEAMGCFPTDHFTFIILSLDYKHYHGVEHQDSTVLVLGPNDPASHDDYREKLMGVASHELFHAWNVTRIRPAEMSPYQFRNETITETGFVTEGFTTYYGDLFLVQSGYFSQESYFKEINLLLKRHFENYGRKESSLIESSRNLWVDGYKNIFPSKKVSIYVKGALCALILDLTIRKQTNHQRSLIDVMKILMSRHTVEKDGYTKEHVYSILEEIGGSRMHELINQLYETTDNLAPILRKALDEIGCELTKKYHPDLLTSHFGILHKDQRIVAIAPSAAEQSLSVGDRIESIDNKIMMGQILSLNTTTSIKIKRGTKTSSITLKKSDARYYMSYEIEELSKSSKVQEINLQKWLGNN